MRKSCLSYCLLLAACGPETASTEDASGAGMTSTGEAATGETTAQPTSTDATSSSTTGSTGSTSSTSDETTDTTTDATCIETIDHEEIPKHPMTCGLPELCPGSEPLLFESSDGKGWTTPEIERARCMAAAVRDRTPGIFSFRNYGVTAWDDLRTVELLGEQAIVTHNEMNDFNVDYSERLVLVQISAYFAECADSSAFAIRKCLIEGFDDVCIDTLTCPN